MPNLSILFFSGLLLYVATIYVRKRSSKLPLPPGPRKYPIVGNLFDVPAKFQWESYARWSREYGKLLQTWLREPRTEMQVQPPISFTSTSRANRSSYSTRWRLRMHCSRGALPYTRIGRRDLYPVDNAQSLTLNSMACRDEFPMVIDLMGWDFNVGTYCFCGRQ